MSGTPWEGTADARRFLSALFQRGDVVELRALKVPRVKTVSGYFDDSAKLIEAAAMLEARKAVGIYVVMNPCKPELLARAANRIAEGADIAATSDNDIASRRWVLIDLDAKRPSGISSTDAEHGAAIMRANEVCEALNRAGWPEPMMIDSGNGAHLYYRIDERNDEAARDRVQKFLIGVAAEFSDDLIQVDLSVFNAARITKLAGTFTRKGDSTPERPHRRSHVISVPGGEAVLV